MVDPEASDLYAQYQLILDERDQEIERADALDEAIREALDVSSGFFGMARTIKTPRRRLKLIEAGLADALVKHGVQTRKEPSQ